MKVLITGGNGFVGAALVQRLACDPKYTAVPTIRTETAKRVAGVQYITTGDLGSVSDQEWENYIFHHKIGAIVHTAARVHLMSDRAVNPLSLYRKVNTGETLRLAELAARGGVRRFIFLSSIKVNGEITETGSAFTPSDKVAPSDPYALSKYEAEIGLKEIAGRSAMSVVCIRPALIYGAGVKANFLNLIRLVDSGLPLPLRQVVNSRSLLALDNLIDLIVACLQPRVSKFETFLASDGYDISTPELIGKIAFALGKKPRLFSMPRGLILAMAKVVNRAEPARRLLNSLQVDSSYTRQVLSWTPPVSLDEGISSTVDYYLRNRD